MRKKLLVDQKANELIAECAILVRLVRYADNACVHMVRAADSASFNIGEAVVSFQPKVKAAKYDIARREANEVLKALDALVAKRKLTEQQVAKARDLADHIVAMLTNLIKAQEARA